MSTQIILQGRSEDVVSLAQIRECDVMITDPEYSRHTHESAVSSSSTRGTRKRELGFAHMTPASRHWLARAAASVRRWSVLYSDVEGSAWLRMACQAAGVEYIRTIPWVRWSMPQLSGDRPPQGFEHVIVCHPKGAKRWNGPGNLTHLDHLCLRGEGKHRAQKPLDQALDLVAWFSDPGECVFDPRAGAGTIGLACALLKRDYVGVEADAEWAAKARARLTGAWHSSDLERAKRWARRAVANAKLEPFRRLHLWDLEIARQIIESEKVGHK